ncbi:PspA/IM30 family protein [Planococcus sp. N028]|uniref:PspA/IM30 family protein n=1 Tax=Planococcus shixiaomingii TaxID=3058393 RepID=A0ABT8N4I7_9BACL|nr:MULTISPECIES: PspA/IM30 family protein [unclassified Planococcus (in: firmicutes)]MDN7242804.1 PspA/IM30 family protein [Planococcus sp. N028]WKA55573.1 PspA/IM30 family protein [Planococcus sp. N022]
MEILKRFRDIMASNMNAMLDQAEDPEKMIDQYLRDLNSDLGKVKAETAAIMAAEKRERRELEELQKEIDDMQRYAVKALEANNEDDARKFLQRKAELTDKEKDRKTAVELAATNTQQMRQMHEKLQEDIGELESRRSELKGKASVAKAQQKMNDLQSSVNSSGERISAFDRMEQKINQELDEAMAMQELNKSSATDIKDLASKYETDSGVEDELASLKAGVNVDDELEALKSQVNKGEQ